MGQKTNNAGSVLLALVLVVSACLVAKWYLDLPVMIRDRLTGECLFVKTQQGKTSCDSLTEGMKYAVVYSYTAADQ